MPDWKGQPIRNLRSIKFGVGGENSLVSHRCFFFFFFFFYFSFFFFILLHYPFLIPRSPSPPSFVHSFILATPFCISRNADTPAGDPLDSPAVWILTGDKRSEDSNEISTSFTVKVCLIFEYRPRNGNRTECARVRAREEAKRSYAVINTLEIIRRIFIARRKSEG